MNRSYLISIIAALLLAIGGAAYYYRSQLMQYFTPKGTTVVTGEVIEIKSAGQLDDITKGNTLSVVKYYAPWCGYCQKMAPVYDKLASEFKGAVLTKVDFTTDHGKQIAQKAGVGGFPTFALYKGGKKIDEVVGANEPELRTKIAKHAA